jgi:hypothetical protein
MKRKTGLDNELWPKCDLSELLKRGFEAGMRTDIVRPSANIDKTTPSEK